MPAIAVAVVGAAVSSRGARRAASAQTQSTDQAVAEQQRQYDQTREDQQPWMTAGRNALSQLQDPGAFQASPGYNFVRGEGTRDIGNHFSASGGAFSGNAMKALTEFNSGLASQEHGNWFNQRLNLAGLGSDSAQQVGALGANKAGNVGNALMEGGNARASGVINRTNALTGLGSDLVTLNSLGRNRGTRQQRQWGRDIYSQPGRR